jgi:hypothetical protein
MTNGLIGFSTSIALSVFEPVVGTNEIRRLVGKSCKLTGNPVTKLRSTLIWFRIAQQAASCIRAAFLLGHRRVSIRGRISSCHNTKGPPQIMGTMRVSLKVILHEFKVTGLTVQFD